jgi:hypothetical protein
LTTFGSSATKGSMVIGYVLKCDKCGWVWMTQTLPKGCSKCKQRGYGSVQGEILDESPDILQNSVLLPEMRFLPLGE